MESNISTQKNKRKHERYNVELGTFAVFRKNMSVLPGLIVDISKGGLAFFYHEGEDWPIASNELYNLFGEKCSVDDVSLKTAYDSEVFDKKHPVYMILSAQKQGPARIRRRGVKFGELTGKQRKNLEGLIDEFQMAKEKQVTDDVS
jgi:hypothetical protein